MNLRGQIIIFRNTCLMFSIRHRKCPRHLAPDCESKSCKISSNPLQHGMWFWQYVKSIGYVTVTESGRCRFLSSDDGWLPHSSDQRPATTLTSLHWYWQDSTGSEAQPDTDSHFTARHSQNVHSHITLIHSTLSLVAKSLPSTQNTEHSLPVHRPRHGPPHVPTRAARK